MLQLLRSRKPSAPNGHATPPSFDVALQLAPDAMLVLDPDGRIVRANTAATILLGRSTEALLGAEISSCLIRSDREQFEQRLRAAGEATQRFDAGLKLPSKETCIVAVALSGARDLGLAASSVIMTARDVTEERDASATLGRSESRYRHLFEAASDAIMTFDSFGRFTTVNGAAEQISGYTHEELIGRFFGPLLAVESLPRALIEFRRALSGAAGQFETTMRHKNGERRHLTVNYACPQRSREVICMIRDATAEKQLQQQLIQSDKMAAIGQLVSGVAHELNNPLASISAFAQLMLADKKLETELRHSAEVIVSESMRASRIVHNLLTFARQHRAEKEAADINDVLRTVLELRMYELRVRGIQVVCQLEEETPPVTLVDVHQLQQVLLNLVTNAEQAMMELENDRHQLTLRTRTLPKVIRIEVEDSGHGIQQDAMHQIFNPFFTTKPTGKGTGLGLSISVGIVGEHGGRIWADNISGGARFTIELPRVECTMGVAGPQSSRPAVRMAESLRILVADDEEPLRAALDQYLTSEGHSVVSVGSGSEAIWRAEGEERFDVLLLDLRMPDVSGQQLFDRWRRERRELSDRVVFMTGDTVSAELQSYLSASGRPYIAKPFEFSAIAGVLPPTRVA